MQEKHSVFKRDKPTLQNMKIFYTWFFFVGHFCPPVSGSSRPKLMRIQIQNTADVRISLFSDHLSWSTRITTTPCSPWLSSPGPWTSSRRRPGRASSSSGTVRVNIQADTLSLYSRGTRGWHPWSGWGPNHTFQKNWNHTRNWKNLMSLPK